MAHRVHYATRIDWTPRKLHSNAVFWHSLAPEWLEPRTLFPYPLKPSMFPQTCAHYVVLGNADPITFAYAYSESGCLDTGSPAYGSIDIVSVGTLLSASVFWTSIPDSTHLSDIKTLVCAHPISAYWYAICPGIVHPISAYWYAECLAICYGVSPYRYAVCLGIDYEISPYRYAEYLGIDHQITPYRYAVYSDIVHHIPP